MVKKKKNTTISRMAPQPTSSLTAQIVGNAFTKQYYHVLHTSPELVFKFYQDSSVISRPNADGVMTSVSTGHGINEKICSLNYKDCKTNIKTVDAQTSYKGGIAVLVTGCLMGANKLKRAFSQSFFLAPQENGYFVLNDVFRFMKHNEPLENHLVNDIDGTSTISSILNSDSLQVRDPTASSPAALVMDQDNAPNNANDSVNHEELIYRKEDSPELVDNSCAVCAETLEWVAYGPCGHREVCSTCTIRLRIICNDQCCCICKSESNIIFVTKSRGDYTSMISDFSAFPPNPTEGQVGQYWFHEGAQAYFDDGDHYMKIKNVCKLSCNVCDRKNETRSGGSKTTRGFDCIEQLKIHLLRQHKLFICSLCLEGRKIFTREQTLYNKEQLDQHVKTGDSVVDGGESERGGFMGHPICEFCQNPFYGDNELYLHMSTEHFTCHICQGWHPGGYEYYNDYDDLEMHFGREHFLCKDEACLAKKFVVFAAESELKRHNANEHGGRKSRSESNFARQIPTSVWSQRIDGQTKTGRASGMHPNLSNIQISMAIQDSHETFDAARFPASTNPETSSRCSQIPVQKTASNLLDESSFPPLPMALSRSGQKSRNNGSKHIVDSSRKQTTATHESHRNTIKALNSELLSSSSPSFSQIKPATNDYSSIGDVRSTRFRSSTADDLVSSFNITSFSTNRSSSRSVGHSSTANLVGFDKTISSAEVDDKWTPSIHPVLKVEDVQAANRALVEKFVPH